MRCHCEKSHATSYTGLLWSSASFARPSTIAISSSVRLKMSQSIQRLDAGVDFGLDPEDFNGHGDGLVAAFTSSGLRELQAGMRARLDWIFFSIRAIGSRLAATIRAAHVGLGLTGWDGVGMRLSGNRAYDLPQHLLYFLPEPHGHLSFLPILGVSRCAGCCGAFASAT